MEWQPGAGKRLLVGTLIAIALAALFAIATESAAGAIALGSPSSCQSDPWWAFLFCW